MAKKVIIQILKKVLCIIMVVLVVAPILLTLFAALKTKTAINTTSPLALPASDQITFDNFKKVLTDKYLLIGFKTLLLY